ncbi:unnamed protein product, partial [Callosobruchus maculatus]
MDHRYRHQYRYDTSQCFAMSPPPHQPQQYHYPPQGVHFRNRLYRVTEAHRALELLEDYHSKLIRPQDKQLRLAIERVIRIFKSRLFQAL